MTDQSLDLTSAKFKSDPFPTFAKMREIGPLIRTKQPLVGDVWVTSTYEAATLILRDKATFVVQPSNAGRKSMAGLQWWMPRSLRALANNMLGKDEPDHRRLRQLVESAFMRQSIDAMKPRLEELAERQLDVLEQQANRNGGRVDFMEHFARPFPLAVISELLGLPEEDRSKFLRWGSSFTSAGSAFGFMRAIPAIWKITAYFRRQFEVCRREPRPGMLSALVAEEQEGSRLNEQELLATAFLLLLAGHETTVHLLTIGLLSLLQHPDQKLKLLSDWSKADSAVDEMLRYNSTVQMTKPRYASKDVELYGQTIRRGEFVMPMLAAANCDPAQFPNPETFDVDRSPNAHIAFGTGMHVCLGLKLARAEGAIAFEKLFTRFPELDLTQPSNELQWSERIGTRAVHEFPLRLGKPTERSTEASNRSNVAAVSN